MARHALPGHFVLKEKVEEAMTFKLLAVTTAALALAIGGCNKSENSNGAAPDQPAKAAKAAGDQTIVGSLDKNSRFFQAAHAVGLDSTLAGPGPYTVLVPSDDAFGKVEGALKDSANPANRAELTRILTFHILPGTVLAEDLGKAVDNGKGKALIQTMNGETLTATKDGGKIVLSDASGGKATIVEADQKRSNGVVQSVDAILTPSAGGAPKK
ncbi:MAG: fasciclin domain-containing protein [Sphingomonas sp.]|nr:fasciclin domain-containing protein [Sphingomonas sp.]